VSALAELTGSDLRQLASIADLRELQRRHAFEALCAGPPLSGSLPLGPLSAEILEAAMSCLAHWSTPGLVRAADQYAAGRLPQEVVDRVVVDVIRRRDQGIS
jgi:hypothetical protein